MTVAEPLRPADLDDAVIATVAYSDIFDMPLEVERVQPFLIGEVATVDEVGSAVDRLVDNGRLGRTGALTHLPGREEVLAVHAERVERAAEMWEEAGRWGRRLGRLPFVRAVAVTGGLACDSVADHDDIDYLIITVPGRLWLARLFCVTLVHVGRLRKVDLCPNYLVASDALLLSERTSYTARELAQMIDITGPELLTEMRNDNAWLLDHLPNASLAGRRDRVLSAPVGPMRRVIEAVVGSRWFDRVEKWEMDRKIRRLTDVASRRAEVGRPDESSFSPSVCKGHMVGNAAGIEVAWHERLRQHRSR